MTTGTGIVLMGADEAREKTEQIRQNLTSARSLLLEMYEREGWKALGYDNWREYGQAEFGYSERYTYYLMQAARVEENLCTIVQKPIPENQLRPLTSLEPEQQRAAWQLAVDTAPNGKVTGAHVERIVEYYEGMHLEPPGNELTQAAALALAKNGTPHVAHNSGNNEWYTPKEYIHGARYVMGGIDLDPASSARANEIVGATTHYTAEDNGLKQPWFGRVWMNPPYARELVDAFAARLVTCLTEGAVDQACVLVNNATDTHWFQSMLGVCSAVCFLKGRVRFLDPAGNPTGAPLQGQAILYFGPNHDRFRSVFYPYGVVLAHA